MKKFFVILAIAAGVAITLIIVAISAGALGVHLDGRATEPVDEPPIFAELPEPVPTPNPPIYEPYVPYVPYEPYKPYIPEEPCFLEEMLQEIEEFFNTFDDNISIFFENINTGFVARHNAERVFFGASATKAPFALYIYYKAEQGRANLNNRVYFTASDYWHGSGQIRHRYTYYCGVSFTQRELLRLMISISDNVATRMLRRAHGLNGYRDFIENIGGNTHFIQNLTYSYLSADEAGLLMREKFHFIENSETYGALFKQNLLENRYPFIVSTYPVASKSGWAQNFGGAYHDMAIVYAPSPYILAILSNFDGTPADRRIFAEISNFFENFNERWFAAHP